MGASMAPSAAAAVRPESIEQMINMMIQNVVRRILPLKENSLFIFWYPNNYTTDFPIMIIPISRYVEG